jgi:hypothetical protein
LFGGALLLGCFAGDGMPHLLLLLLLLLLLGELLRNCNRHQLHV